MNLQSMRNLIDPGSTNNPDEIFVLTKEGLADLTRAIFSNVNIRIQDRITTDISDASTDNHVASAKSVHNAVKGLSKIKTLTIASGDINEASITPDPNTLYLVRKNAADTKGAMYIWVEGLGYINCGGELDEEPEVSVNAIPSDVISQIVSESYSETDPGINVATLELEE